MPAHVLKHLGVTITPQFGVTTMTEPSVGSVFKVLKPLNYLA